MKKFLVTYNHFVYKPSSYDVYKRQLGWSLQLEAKNLEEAKEKLSVDWGKNPAYFNFKEL